MLFSLVGGTGEVDELRGGAVIATGFVGDENGDRFLFCSDLPLCGIITAFSAIGGNIRLFPALVLLFGISDYCRLLKFGKSSRQNVRTGLFFNIYLSIINL